MPGGGGALATVHSGQSQAATGQHDGSALLQPGLTCTGRTEAVLSSGARRRIWANFDRRHSSPRARSDKMLTLRKLRLVQRMRLPCEPAAGWLVVDCRGRLLWATLFIVPHTVLWFTHTKGVPGNPRVYLENNRVCGASRDVQNVQKTYRRCTEGVQKECTEG